MQIMRFHYAGKYLGDEADLPQRNPMPAGTVAFREPEDTRTLAVVASVIALVLIVVLWALLWVRTARPVYSFAGLALAFVAMVPHELLHAIWFKEDVFMYTNLREGMLFVVGTEDMGRGRFVWMCMAPAVVLGIVPLVIWSAHPAPGLDWLGIFGLFSFSMASGDFINVFNALTQVPRNARIFLSGMHSYWYVP